MRSTILTISIAVWSIPAQAGDTAEFWKERSAHKTELTRKRPSPQPYAPLEASGELSLFSYTSTIGRLKGFVRLPKEQKRKSSRGYPVLLYLHGGFALGAQDVLDCERFTDDGYAVVAPSYRGENGNPGHQEMFYGELDDAVAALRWIERNRDLDGDRVVVFGHSAGGALSALMTLVPGLKVKAFGSAGGFYSEEVFEVWEAPFKLTEKEKRLRVAYRWAHEFTSPHFACVGVADIYPAAVIRSIQDKSDLLRASFVAGNHFSSLPECFGQFLALANDRLSGE